jgi:hypothetical protein
VHRGIVQRRGDLLARARRREREVARAFLRLRDHVRERPVDGAPVRGGSL